MTAQERTKAVERFQHEVEAPVRLFQHQQQERGDLIKWRETALPTINQSVKRVSVDFDVLGSPFLFASIPIQAEGSTCFRVKTKKGHRLLKKLQFDVAAGQVTATANVTCADLPVSVSVRDVTEQWVEGVAERVLIAMLLGA